MEKAIFGAGCFWGMEATFRRLPGVIETSVGYAGGHTAQPTYRELCDGNTGHTEVVLVEFDAEQISFLELLEVFWASHDATQRHGTQYRSVIFFCNAAQQQAALESRRGKQASISRTIVTEILPSPAFHRAEEYHQRYHEKRGLAFSAF